MSCLAVQFIQALVIEGDLRCRGVALGGALQKAVKPCKCMLKAVLWVVKDKWLAQRRQAANSLVAATVWCVSATAGHNC